ncbi:MAG: hypothetical protein ABIK65_08905 [Candidatus Eisenbacteria bacterium]
MGRVMQASFLGPLMAGAGEGGGLYPTRALVRNRSCPRILDQVRRVRYFFPELRGTAIRVGFTRAAQGYASLEDDTIWMNPYRLTHLTIAHELVHLVQNRGLVPGGEKTADLHALARHITLVDDLPGYLRVPPELRRRWNPARLSFGRLLHHTAARAIADSDGKPRRAIHLFEKEIDVRWEESRDALAGKTKRAAPLALFG